MLRSIPTRMPRGWSPSPWCEPATCPSQRSSDHTTAKPRPLACPKPASQPHSQPCHSSLNPLSSSSWMRRGQGCRIQRERQQQHAEHPHQPNTEHMGSCQRGFRLASPTSSRGPPRQREGTKPVPIGETEAPSSAPRRGGGEVQALPAPMALGCIPVSLPWSSPWLLTLPGPPFPSAFSIPGCSLHTSYGSVPSPCEQGRKNRE